MEKHLSPIRNEIVLATKYSPAPLKGQDNIPGGKLSRNGVRVAVENSLRRLQTDHIDIYYAHRVPAEAVPEEMAEWFGELIREGKIISWGVSEATAEQIRRAHAVAPLTAVQSEYSMMARQWEKDVIPLCRELGIGFIAYSPMAGGLLSGVISNFVSAISEKMNPRFSERMNPTKSVKMNRHKLT